MPSRINFYCIDCKTKIACPDAVAQSGTMWCMVPESLGVVLEMLEMLCQAYK